MKNLPLLLLTCLLLGGTLSAVNANDGTRGTKQNQMLITIGQKTFTALLEDNATATVFKAMLPLKLTLDELNGNEKVIRLSNSLPTNDSNPGSIQTGDLMIWNSRSLVLFYKSFPTSYSYTRLGRINDTAGLSAAVGAGKVTAIFERKSEEEIPAIKPSK